MSRKNGVIKDPLEVRAALDQHFRAHKAKPEETREYLGHKVYLADSGPHWDAKNLPNLPKDMGWMRQGYFIAVWGVIRGHAVWGRPAYFEINHNIELSEDARKWARLNAAMADAEEYIRMGIYGGLLENRSSIILPAIPGLH